MNNGRWTPEEEQYIRDNAGKQTLEEMSAYVNRSPLAVQLFMHRRKIVTGQLVKRNLVQEILRIKFRHPEDFMSTRKFYTAVKINQMRWWDIYYGRKPVTQQEYIALSDYFGITLQEAFEARQLNMFNNEEL
ncbi:MAG: XRE family transcriptional regulator [Bacteroides sp.]|uniref:XRE family transcriptional regulator n=1 Tax=Bacteroides sp. TaxID=29523 RepID=UPI002FC98E89